MHGIAQTHNVTYDTVQLYIGGGGSICAGEQSNLLLNNGYGVTLFGYGDMMSYTLDRETTGAGTRVINCQIDGIADPKITGSGVLSTSNQPGWICPSPNGSQTNQGYQVTALVEPQDTTLYSISWNSTVTINDHNLSTGVMSGGTHHRYYHATTTINVVDPPAPQVNSTTFNVEAGNTIPIEVTNHTGFYWINLYDGCGNLLRRSRCTNPWTCPPTRSMAIGAPQYSTQMNLQVEYEWSVNCIGPRTNITVNVRPDFPTTGSPTILAVENELSTAGVSGRSDYHNYTIVSSSTYTSGIGNKQQQVDQLFTSIKQNPYHQIPKSKDFVESFTGPFGTTITPTNIPLDPTGNPSILSNGSEFNLASTNLREKLSLASIPASILTNCPSISSYDPIEIYIDDQSKCITNYTKSGHILYPGRVRRCVSADDCGNITILTEGEGITCFGDNIFGEFIKDANLDLGGIGFRSINERVKQEYD